MDARILACRIANPLEMKSSELDQWVKDVDYTALAGEFGSLVKESPYALTKANKWIKSRQEFVRDSGYSSMTQILKHHPDLIDTQSCRDLLERIEKQIHSSPNYAKKTQ